MSKKLYDLAVKTGEYTNREGETKGKWQNIGACLESDDGNKFILLDRWFNPAGLPNPEDRGNIMVSMFRPQSKVSSTGDGAGSNASHQRPQESPPTSGGGDDFDDDIPF